MARGSARNALPFAFCTALKGLSELPRPLAGPTLHNHFLIGKELDGVAPLCVHHAEETALPAGKGKVRHGCGHANVDPHVASGNGIAELTRRSAGGREDGAGVAIG